MQTSKSLLVVRFITTSILSLLYIFQGFPLYAQNCTNSISGKIVDDQGSPLPGVTVRITNLLNTGDVTDTNGLFKISNLCNGLDTLSFEMIELQPLTKTVVLEGRDTFIHLVLKPDKKHLHEVEIIGQKPQEVNSVAHVSLSQRELDQSMGNSLGNMVSRLPGVTEQNSGPTLSKPVIHGLTGSRVLIMNNGVRQEGQQWGDDHAPEIDPSGVGQVTVVKGASSVRYGSDALAGVIIMNPPDLPETKGITGEVGTRLTSNGRGGSLFGRLEGATGTEDKGFSWRIQASGKRTGNIKTPHYYLDNTATSQKNVMAQLGYRHGSFSIDGDYTHYQTKIGIYTGSDVSDSLGLQEAFENRAHPNTPDYFTYKIGSGRQQVQHDVAQIRSKYDLGNAGKLSLDYSYQRDLRQEFENEEQGTNPMIPELPDDWFHLVTNTLDLVYDLPYTTHFSGEVGVSGRTRSNQYRGLDPIPLIPNYQDYSLGIFAIEKYTINRWLIEGGIRYDWLRQNIFPFDTTTRQTHKSIAQYQNITATAGITYAIDSRFSTSANFGMGWRPPGIEERYMMGVHTSAAQYVIGDSSLSPERAYNSSISLDYKGHGLTLSTGFYLNEISNFAYLNPIGTITEEGTSYRAYKYVQDQVRMMGIDFDAGWDVVSILNIHSKISLLRATNKTLNGGLINMPPARFVTDLTVHGIDWGAVNHPYLTLENISVLKQNYIVPAQEALLPPPPPGYSIWNIRLGGAFKLGKNNLEVNLGADNLTNKVYSDYLNQFRYFAYEQGFNFWIGLNFSF